MLLRAMGLVGGSEQCLLDVGFAILYGIFAILDRIFLSMLGSLLNLYSHPIVGVVQWIISIISVGVSCPKVASFMRFWALLPYSYIGARQYASQWSEQDYTSSRRKNHA